MKNNTKLKGITIIRIDSIESDSAAKVSEVIAGHEAGIKIFGFLAKTITKAIKVLAPKVGLQVVEAKAEPDVETKVEPKTETAKSEAKPEAEPEIRSKVKAAFAQEANPNDFNYSKFFNSKKRKEKGEQSKSDADDVLRELRKFKEELKKKYKF